MPKKTIFKCTKQLCGAKRRKVTDKQILTCLMCGSEMLALKERVASGDRG